MGESTPTDEEEDPAVEATPGGMSAQFNNGFTHEAKPDDPDISQISMGANGITSNTERPGMTRLMIFSRCCS